MSDDPCECIFNHETAMRRLLSLLRDSQGYCTDSECIQDAPGPQGAGILAGGNNLLMITVLWGILALAMYFMRPNSMRSRPAESLSKPGPSHDPNGQEPPAPDVN
ncbi:unnamed protein product [Toxocara canis]|nr:unnamed protein product [Toxocara canis]